LEFVVTAVVQQNLCPRLEKRLSVGQTAAAGAPDAFFVGARPQPGVAVGPTRRPPLRAPRPTPPAASPLTAPPPPLLLSRLSRLGRLGLLALSLALGCREGRSKHHGYERQHKG